MTLRVHTHYDMLAQTRATLSGARWNPREKAWEVPATPAWLERARSLTESIGGADGLAEQLRARLQAQSGQRCRYTWRTPPWKHQERITSYALLSDVCLLDCWMGTGKTKAVLDAIGSCAFNRVLVLCPKTVVSVWPGQYAQHGHGSYRIYAPLDGATDSKATKLGLLLQMSEPLIAVFNYEACLGKNLGKLLLDTKWDCVVFDEAHRLKCPSGAISRFAAKIRAGRRIALTGTPLPHSLLDAYGMYRALDSGIFGLSYVAFRNQYAVMGGYGGHQVFGFKNEPEFKERFNSIRLHVAGDVLDLPPMQVIDRDVELSADERRIYREMENDFLVQLESGEVTAANALAKLLILQQITGGFVYKEGRVPEQVGTSKAAALAEILDELPPDEPVVVFARFREDLRTILSTALERERKCGMLLGGHNDLASWQAGEVPILAAQIQAGSLGIDLTRARYAVFFSLGYSLGDYTQALERLHRPGQTRPTIAYRLIARGTIDRKIARALDTRRDVIQNLLEIPRKEWHNDSGT